MRKILILLLAIVPLLAQANKHDDKNDAKYLAGAVTMSNGKVSFSEEIILKDMTAGQIYKEMEMWAENRFQPKDKYWSRVAYKNAEKNELAVVGEEYMVFKSTALSLDRTRIYYQLRIRTEDNKCNLEMTNIRYWYEENRDGGQKYQAEEWITDDMALNKKKNKLSPITGKFRSKTIDLKDEIFESARESLGIWKRGTENSVQTQNVETAKENKAEKSELHTVKVDQLPDNMNHLINTSRIELNAGGEQVQIENNSWGGIGKMINKDVAYLIVNPSRIVANAILANSDNFSIKIYKGNSEQESIVIECKKPMLQKMSAEELKQFNAKLSGNAEYNLYICEIKTVMMR